MQQISKLQIRVVFAAKCLPNHGLIRLIFNYIFSHKFFKPEKLSEICKKIRVHEDCRHR